MDADRLAELDVERQFLLRSLADLEREHEAGDVDDVDYETLRDGYTARAAATLREIERGSQSPPPPPKHWGRILAWVGVVAVVAVAAGFVLARSWGDRGSGDVSPTGGIDDDGTVSAMLSEARSSMETDPLHAIDVFADVLQVDPDNVEAITYGAWLSVASALQSGNEEFFAAAADPALAQFDRAIELDPTYADPHCFTAIVLFYRGAATPRTSKRLVQQHGWPSRRSTNAWRSTRRRTAGRWPRRSAPGSTRCSPTNPTDPGISEAFWGPEPPERFRERDAGGSQASGGGQTAIDSILALRRSSTHTEPLRQSALVVRWAPRRCSAPIRSGIRSP